MTSYTVYVDETKADREFLNKNKYQLQVAKSVSSSGGDPTFNVVYKSDRLAPEMEVSWNIQYGLNWTQNVPDPGAKVTNSGNWQACDPGNSYNLDSNGDWTLNPNDPHAVANALNVGSNDYGSPINIIVGIQNKSTQAWQAIYLDSSQLPPKGNGQYVPRESVQIWYQENDLTETMISKQSTANIQYDMTPTPTRYFTFDTKKGTWYNQDTPFPHD